MKLYELQGEIWDLLRDVAPEALGDLPDELKAQLDALTMERDAKFDAIRCIIAEQEAAAEAVSLEVERLRKIGVQRINRSEALRAYLKMVIPIGHKIKTLHGSCFWKETQAVLVGDEAQIPRKWWRRKVTTEVDKAAIREYLTAESKKPRSIPGVSLMTNHNLVIK